MNSFILVIILVVLIVQARLPIKRENDQIDDAGEPLHLTPYINSDDLQTAKKLARVTLTAPRQIESYAGYFTVNKEYNSNLFHWYFVAEENPESAPLLLWLNGGPGASSLLGLFKENGAFEIVNDTLTLRKIYWSKNHHVIYLECPVGTGFSYTENERGYANTSEEVAIDVHNALVQFFEMYPDLKNNDFYLTGESYAGKYIPAIGHQIIIAGQIKNFKGVAIGNGSTHPKVQKVGYGDYLYQQGFLDDNQLEAFKEGEAKCIQTYEDGKDPIPVCLSVMNLKSPTSDSLFKQFTGYTYFYNILQSRKPSSYGSFEPFLERSAVRKAIHAGPIQRFNKTEVFGHLYGELFDSEIHHVEELLQKHFKVLLFNGQLDITVSYRQTVNYLKQLKFPESEYYTRAPRHIWYVDDEVAGYIKTAGSLTEVMVIGAGHLVPREQPERAFDLITKFTQDKLPK